MLTKKTFICPRCGISTFKPTDHRECFVQKNNLLRFRLWVNRLSQPCCDDAILQPCQCMIKWICKEHGIEAQ